MFILRYYALWIDAKSNNQTSNYLHSQSMADFFGNSLDGYNQINLLNDYHHIRKHHFSNDLIGFFRDKLQTECDTECVCMHRNNRDREIYTSTSTEFRCKAYWIDTANIKQGSFSEIRELHLQHLLDVIHCSFVHNALSDGVKFISQMDGNNVDAKEEEEEGQRVYDEFGLYMDYWKENRKDFCGAKYNNLKAELLNNSLHAISWNDFNCVYERANNLMHTQHIKYCMNAKREFDAMRVSLKYGQNISIDHLIAIVTYTNYKTLQKRLKTACCKVSISEKKDDVMSRNTQS